MRTLATLFISFSLALLSQVGHAEELLLEDYENNGAVSVADWANSFEDADGNANAARDAGKYAVVSWATKWSGIPSTNYDAMDLSKYKTYQVDVMVEKGQPVEDNANFYVQLLCQADAGYAYWESYVPQSLIPADGKWHRLHVPIKSMTAAAGDGAEKPTDRKSIIGCCNGMTFDEDGSKFKFKRCAFDNVILSTKEVEKLVAKPITKKPSSKKSSTP